MNLKKTIFLGLPVGFLMGFMLFVFGAILALSFWKGGAPPGKFPSDLIPPVILLLSKMGIQTKVMSPLYFFLTKLIYGTFLGLIYGIIYTKYHNSISVSSFKNDIVFGLFLWFIIVSPIYPIYLSFKSELFWLLYSLSGLMVFVLVFGFFYRKNSSKEEKLPIIKISSKQSYISGSLSGLIMAIIAFIGAVLTTLLWEESPVHYSFSNIFSIPFIFFIILFNSFWGTLMGCIFRKIQASLHSNLILSGIYFGLMLWFIRFSFDVVHKLCYTQKSILTITTMYMYPLVYMLIFGIVLSILYDRFNGELIHNSA